MPPVQRSVSTLHTVTSQARISILTSAFPIQPVLLGVNKKCHWWLFVEKAQLLFLLLCSQNCPILDPDISKARDEKYAQCRVEWRFFVQRFPAARSLIQWRRGRARRQLSSRMRRRGRTREEYKRNNNTMANRAAALPNYGKGFPQEDDTGSHAGRRTEQHAETLERHTAQRHRATRRDTVASSDTRQKSVFVSWRLKSDSFWALVRIVGADARLSWGGAGCVQKCWNM